MKIAPVDVRQQRFAVKFRGFDPQEVDAFLEKVAEELEELSRENARLKDDLAKHQQEMGGYLENEANLKKTLLSAQAMKEEITLHAKKEAELVLRDADLKADEIIRSSRSQVKDVTDDLTDLIRRRKRFILNLRSMLETHLRMLDMEEQQNTPDEEPQKEERPEKGKKGRP